MSNYNSLFLNTNLSVCILKISCDSHKAVFLLKTKENEKTEKSSYSPLSTPIVKIWLFIHHTATTYSLARVNCKVTRDKTRVCGKVTASQNALASRWTSRLPRVPLSLEGL